MKKIALVTGASSGIGNETALKLLENGFTVYGAARRTDKMQNLKDKGGFPIFLDITKKDSIDSCVNEILSKEGKIDLLVNNAGFGLGGAIEDVSIEEARNQFEVNVFGLIELTKKILPSMRKEHSGRIINVSSMAGKFSSPFLGWYHATKYSVEALSDSLRMEVKQFGIKVVIIEPGLIKTNWGIIAAENMEKHSENSAYSKSEKNAAEIYRKFYGENVKTSEPKVISDAILKAATKKNPKIRYNIGKYSKLFIWFKKHVSDKFYDNTILKIFGMK